MGSGGNGRTSICPSGKRTRDQNSTAAYTFSTFPSQWRRKKKSQKRRIILFRPDLSRSPVYDVFAWKGVRPCLVLSVYCPCLVSVCSMYAHHRQESVSVLRFAPSISKLRSKIELFRFPCLLPSRFHPVYMTLVIHLRKVTYSAAIAACLPKTF